MHPIRLFAVLALAHLLTAPVPAAAQPGPDGDDRPAPKKLTKKTGPQPAEILVHIPYNAKLTIDDYLTTQTGIKRTFVTPPLAPGRAFTYLLKATWKEEMHTFVRMAVVSVQAGEETVVDLRQNSEDASSSQVVYIPTPQKVVDRMLQMAKVTKDDVVFDLGCGDGRVVITAAKKYGARGVGVDIDPERVQESLENARAAQVGNLVEIRQGDALKVKDLERATVVVTYMLPEFMEKLRPILRKQLQPGTRIVAHDYPVPGWEPADTVTVPGSRERNPHTLYLWRVRPRAAE
jgi:uncharacterized protein (TIGR03000 family)